MWHIQNNKRHTYRRLLFNIYHRDSLRCHHHPRPRATSVRGRLPDLCQQAGRQAMLAVGRLVCCLDVNAWMKANQDSDYMAWIQVPTQQNRYIWRPGLWLIRVTVFETARNLDVVMDSCLTMAAAHVSATRGQVTFYCASYDPSSGPWQWMQPKQWSRLLFRRPGLLQLRVLRRHRPPVSALQNATARLVTSLRCWKSSIGYRYDDASTSS